MSMILSYHFETSRGMKLYESTQWLSCMHAELLNGKEEQPFLLPDRYFSQLVIFCGAVVLIAT